MTYPKYEQYQYLYPPRAPGSHAIDKSQIRFTVAQGYAAQKKKNGTNNMVFTNGKDIIFKTRHGDEANHKLWKPLPDHLAFFEQFGPNWYVFCSELLHSKVAGIRNEIFIHDVLVWNGDYLVGSTFMDRQVLLQQMVQAFKGEDEGDQYRITPYITIAKLFNDPKVCKALYQNLKPEDEGLVFKRMTGVLQPCISETANADWQFKCRIPWTAGTF